jgi:hypothetical protein
MGYGVHEVGDELLVGIHDAVRHERPQEVVDVVVAPYEKQWRVSALVSKILPRLRATEIDQLEGIKSFE